MLLYRTQENIPVSERLISRCEDLTQCLNRLEIHVDKFPDRKQIEDLQKLMEASIEILQNRIDETNKLSSRGIKL